MDGGTSWLFEPDRNNEYLSNRLRFSVRVYCNNAQMTSERVKN